MESKEYLQNNKITIKENLDVKTPIRQLHHLEDKYFIVLDKSIVERLNLLDEIIYFSQEATPDGKIILQLVRCRDSIS